MTLLITKLKNAVSLSRPIPRITGFTPDPNWNEEINGWNYHCPSHWFNTPEWRQQRQFFCATAFKAWINSDLN